MQPIQVSPRSWVDDITDYLEKGILPDDRAQARALQKRSARYTVVDGALYRRSFSKPLLRCVPPHTVQPFLIEIHEGICGGHPGGRSMADKIIRMGYYWPNLRKDAQEYSQKCDKCQNMLTPHTLQPLSRPLFNQPGLSICGGWISLDLY